jgi:hypothetical protein
VLSGETLVWQFMLAAVWGWEGSGGISKTSIENLVGADGEGGWPGLMDPAMRSCKTATADLAVAHRALGIS